MKRLCVALALLAATPAFCSPLPIQPRTGGSGGTPVMTALTGAITAGDPAGTVAAHPAVSGLSCSWAISPTTYFAQNSSTGVVVTSSTPTSVGTYNPVSTCTAVTGGQTLTLSTALSIVASAGSFTPSLDFSDARNGQYLAMIL